MKTKKVQKSAALNLTFVLPWTEVCYPQLGCLTLTTEWYDPIKRPVNSKPWSRDRIGTNFTLATRQAPNGVITHAFVEALKVFKLWSKRDSL